MDDLAVRYTIYQTFAKTGAAPSRAAVAGLVGDLRQADACLRRLHDSHSLVLDDEGEILMAQPFAARPTGHRVVGAGGSWWANCAWDALAIPAALATDATIEAIWMDTREVLDLAVRDGTLSSFDGYVHFAIPPRLWWNDIVHT